MEITEKELEDIIQLITQKTGIVPRESHRTGIKRYVEERLESPDASGLVNRMAFFSQNERELSTLINKATVNETYFFREEKQLDLLRTTIFPFLQKNAPVINIWSAAASTGEEIYSLALLARQSGVQAHLTASDINTQVLEKCRAGLYGENSIRSVDGAKYHKLIAPCRNADGSFQMPAELTQAVDTRQINLLDLAKESLPQNLPQNQHIIFIRNVFIYFTKELRAKILMTLCEKCLAPNGFIFVSMNEIASLEPSIIPAGLERIVSGSVFYFQKKAEA